MRTPTIWLAVTALALGPAGCTYGGSLEGHPEARSPSGVTVEFKQLDLIGELLAVESDAVLVHSRLRGLLRVPFESAEYIKPAGRPRVRFPPAADARADLRLRSRYPQGVSPALLATLLAAYGQDSLIVAGRQP